MGLWEDHALRFRQDKEQGESQLWVSRALWGTAAGFEIRGLGEGRAMSLGRKAVGHVDKGLARALHGHRSPSLCSDLLHLLFLFSKIDLEELAILILFFLPWAVKC